MEDSGTIRAHSSKEVATQADEDIDRTLRPSWSNTLSPRYEASTRNWLIPEHVRRKGYLVDYPDDLEDPILALQELKSESRRRQDADQQKVAEASADDLSEEGTQVESVDMKMVQSQSKVDSALERLSHLVARYRRLEILCRYGDYLADRLAMLRHHIAEDALETQDYRLAKTWIPVSATLCGEEDAGLALGPCQQLIQKAAPGVHLREDTAIFMIHEYAKRNRLVHADLYRLVEERNWNGIAKRCDDDNDKLTSLIGVFDENDYGWIDVISDFRDYWICRHEDRTCEPRPWIPRPIIQEAIDAEIRDIETLKKLAMSTKLARNASCEDRKQAIDAVKQTLGNNLANRKKTAEQKLSDPTLSAFAKIKDALDEAKGEGARLIDGQLLNDVETAIQRKIKLEKECEQLKRRSETLQKQLREQGPIMKQRVYSSIRRRLIAASLAVVGINVAIWYQMRRN